MIDIQKCPEDLVKDFVFRLKAFTNNVSYEHRPIEDCWLVKMELATRVVHLKFKELDKIVVETRESFYHTDEKIIEEFRNFNW